MFKIPAHHGQKVNKTLRIKKTYTLLCANILLGEKNVLSISPSKVKTYDYENFKISACSTEKKTTTEGWKDELGFLIHMTTITVEKKNRLMLVLSIKQGGIVLVHLEQKYSTMNNIFCSRQKMPNVKFEQ